MELFVNTDVAWKPFTISTKSSISNNWLGFNLNTPLEYQKLLYTNAQRTINTYSKIKSKRKLVWSNRTAILKCSKKAVLRFLGKHAWRRPLLSRCTASILERYYRETLSNIMSCDLFEITRNFYSTRGTTTISCPLSYHVYCVVIPRQYK